MVREILQQNKIKPSYHRIRILEYLISGKNHPTVDEIYTALVKEVPTLSKTTVYNTLNLLMDASLVKAITIEDNETRYDAVVTNHGHFKCTECSQIFDFAIDVDKVIVPDLRKFQVDQKNVYYQGICPTCLDKNN
jgi:Fe2+ or Zn2+ uptake regulation protein